MNNEAVEATINVYFFKSRRVRLGALLQTSRGQHRPPPPRTENRQPSNSTPVTVASDRLKTPPRRALGSALQEPI